MNTLSQLVYTSKRKKNCTDAEIDKILAACKRNNHGLDITGVLLYSPTHFIQYLEGDSKAIMGLYDKIKEDDRHERAALISYGPLAKRLFPSWQMGAKALDEKHPDFKTEITAGEKRVFEKVLNGEEEDGEQVHRLIQKFFK